ncbi:MAG: hypothetical protein KF863_21555 [Rubrivivax sp.]|nr:hypothetical protein [Rubrivivax sp.]
MKLADRIIALAARRPADFVIGGQERPYLRRWWLTPWSGLYRDVEHPTWWQWLVQRLPGVYLHQFLRSDDDRALHDHPWANLSILLRGCYVEHRIAAGGIHERELLGAGDWKLRLSGRMAHRVELLGVPCWTLFITGPRYREWGFHCEGDWVHWRLFTAASDRGTTGKGCDA